jgi:MoaA/NifB/PqqE/SkfB family radical SAM enzyme
MSNNWIWNKTFNSDNYVKIVTWTICNAKCYFCFERNDSRIWDNLFESYNKIVHTIIKWSKLWIKDIAFSWWEFTIYNYFFEALALAKDSWYNNISITTNWFEMADKEFAYKALSYLSHIEMSIHTLDNDKSDKIFWVESAGLRNSKALKNVLEFQRNVNPKLKFTVFTTLLKLNLSEIVKLLDSFVYLWVKKMVLLYSLGWKDSYNIVKVAKLLELIEKRYINKLELNFSYIQPCVFSKDFLERWWWDKCFMIRKRWKMLTNSPKWLDYVDKILFWDEMIVTDKCIKCEFYKKNCYWFWKNIYETGWYNTRFEM